MPRPVSNPPNPWSSTHVEWLGEPPPAQIQVYEEEARSIVVENDSPDIPFRYSVNPYRGCQHACAYCYARTTHQYLGFGAGTDFDTRIVVKVNAVELLRKRLSSKSWKGESITFSGVTDCYQPLEASYGLTRALLGVCAEFSQPIGLITKSALVRRDVDVLARLAKKAAVRVYLSIPFAEEALARALEPWAAAPKMRFAALRALSEAGIETGVGIAPMIPGLGDSQIPSILEQARDAGAKTAFLGLMRLPAEVRPVFEERLRAALPLRAEKVLSAQRDMREGKMNEHRFGERMHGVGPRWDVVERLFEVQCARLGLSTRELNESAPAVKPPKPMQGELFGA